MKRRALLKGAAAAGVLAGVASVLPLIEQPKEKWCKWVDGKWAPIDFDKEDFNRYDMVRVKELSVEVIDVGGSFERRVSYSKYFDVTTVWYEIRRADRSLEWCHGYRRPGRDLQNRSALLALDRAARWTMQTDLIRGVGFGDTDLSGWDMTKPVRGERCWEAPVRGDSA